VRAHLDTHYPLRVKLGWTQRLRQSVNLLLYLVRLLCKPVAHEDLQKAIRGALENRMSLRAL